MTAPGELRLMCVLAHPDDESLGTGGLLAAAAAQGVATYLVTATRGERGRIGGQRPGPEVAGPIRESELREAAAVLGVREVALLGYLDGDLDRADPREATSKIVAHLRRVRPQVVVTFPPDGIYGHPDHVAISAHATAAFRRATAEPGGPTTLYHQAISRSDLAQWGEMQAQWAALGAAEGAEPKEPTADDLLQQQRFVELARPDEDFTTEVDVGSVLDRKLAAFACHASQVRQDWSAAPRELLERWMGRETFIRVEPPPLPGERESALRGVV